MKATCFNLVIITFSFWFASCGNTTGQVLFFDNFEQFGNGTTINDGYSYSPSAGPAGNSAEISLIAGTTVIMTNLAGSIRALFDCPASSVATNYNDYTATFAPQTNPVLQINWQLRIDSLIPNTLGAALFQLPIIGNDESTITAFGDGGQIFAVTNVLKSAADLITIGTWSNWVGTVVTNQLVLNYPARIITFSINGSFVATLPMRPDLTNYVDHVTFEFEENTANDAAGNRFAIDEVKIESAASTSASSWQWARRVASTMNPDDELAIGLAIDDSANLYATGWFDGTNDFGGVVLTNHSGGGQDVFAADYNSGCTLQWADLGGGSTTNRDTGRGIGVDTNGNVYVTGGFYAPADFGPNNPPAYPYEQFWISKAQGWFQQSVGGDGVYGTGLAVDSVGNCYAVGYINNGAIVTFDTTNLTSAYFDGYSTFLVKYDSAGALQWARLLDSPDACYSTSVALDGNDNVYVTGEFKTSMSIGATNFTNAADKDGFVAKFDSAGVFQWACQMTGSSDCGAEAVSADDLGNIYVAGGFGNAAGDTVSFGSSITLTNLGNGISGTGIGDAFLAEYDAYSGAVEWARRFGGTNADGFTGVSTDSQGNVYVSGGSGGTSVPEGFNAVVAKYDSNGNLQWTQTSTGTGGAIVFAGPQVDAAGNCYVAGWYQGTVTFGTTVLQPQGYWNYFLAKLATTPLTLGIVWSNALPWLSISGEVSNRFVLEYAPTLVPGNSWQSLTTNTISSNPFLYPDASAAGNSTRFYRARLLP